MGWVPKGWLFLYIFLFLEGAPQKAATQRSLSLDQSVDLVLRQSLTLKKNAIDLANAAYSAEHLWSEIFPSISVAAGVSYGSTLFTGDGFQINQSGFGYSFSMGLTLSLHGGLPHAMKIISLAYQTHLLEYENAQWQLKIQVAKTFYTLIAEKERLSLLQESLNLAEKQREKSYTAFQSGLIPQRDCLQSQLSVETAKLNLSKAQVAYVSSLREFFTLLELDTHTEISLEGTIEIEEIKADPENLIQTYLTKRPDLISQWQTIDRLEYVEKRALLETRGPSLSLSTQWSGSTGNGGLPNGFTDNLRGSLTLSIPIDPWIPGTKKSQSIRSAGTDVEKAKLDLKNTENIAKNQIRSLIANLQNSWNTIEISQLRVKIAEQTHQLTDQAFQMGTVDLLTLEDARNKMSEARQQLMADELVYKLMMLDLAAALNIDWTELGRSTS